MRTLDSATAVHRTAEHRYAVEVPDGWQQGRGAYGGLTIAALVRAVTDALGSPDRPLRSVSAELLAPTRTGEGEIVVDPLRVQGGVAALSARLVQGGELIAHATAVFARARPVGLAGYTELTPPAIPRWDRIPPLPPIPFAPTFTQHFDYYTDGPIPFSGGDARTQGWVHPKRGGGLGGAPALAALADAWWPALYTKASRPAAIATIAYTLQVVDDGYDPSQPVLYKAHAPALRDGYFVEQRELWSPDGRLLALNPQTFAVLS